MTAPLVSVIIPVYNRFDLAIETVNSVVGQSYRPIDIIIVDDCSDFLFNSDDIFPSLGVSIRTIRLPENVGPGAAREAGRLQAHGDFICYLDSDDIWHRDKIQRQVQTLVAHPEAGMCYCISREFVTLPLNGSEKTRNRSDEVFPSFLPHVLYGRPWGTGACMWRRWATDRIGPWLPERVWEDYEYDCRAGCLDIQLCFLPEVLCYYRIRESKCERLQTEFQHKRLLQTPSVIAISQDLHQARKTSDRVINNLIIGMLYNLGLSLIINGEADSGRKCLSQVKRLTTSRWHLKLWIISILTIGHLFHTNLAARLARKLRSIYPAFYL